MFKRKVVRVLSAAAALLMMLLCCGAIAAAEEPEPIVNESEEPEIVLQQETIELAEYTLTFLAYNREILFEEKLTEGDPMVLPFFIPVRDGFLFLHWYSVSESEKTGAFDPFVFGPGIQEDTVLMPFYEALPEIPDEEPAPPEGERPGALPEPEEEEEEEEPENAGMLGDQIVLIIDDPIEEEIEEEEGAQDVVRGIDVFSSHAECIDLGETIRVWAVLTGFTAEDANLMWQYFDADGWHDAEGGADTLEYSFEATSESVNYGWRLAATLKD